GRWDPMPGGSAPSSRPSHGIVHGISHAPAGRSAGAFPFIDFAESAPLTRIMEPPSNLAPRGEPSGALDFAPAAERILATALRLLGGRRAHLYRLDPDGETFTRVAAAGEGDAKTPHGGATSA